VLKLSVDEIIITWIRPSSLSPFPLSASFGVSGRGTPLIPTPPRTHRLVATYAAARPIHAVECQSRRARGTVTSGWRPGRRAPILEGRGASFACDMPHGRKGGRLLASAAARLAGRTRTDRRYPFHQGISSPGPLSCGWMDQPPHRQAGAPNGRRPGTAIHRRRGVEWILSVWHCTQRRPEGSSRRMYLNPDPC
jgi:hypothetical protein